MKRYELLISKLKKGSILKSYFCKLLTNSHNHSKDCELEFQILKASGMPLSEDEDRVFLETLYRNYKDEIFCFVDIETNGNKPENSQIIEIGAIKYKNGLILDNFETFVYADYVPEYVSKVTNITQFDLINAPRLNTVLRRFREFLGSSVFVAHNVDFDFNFISKSLIKANLGELTNRKLCTIDLSKKTIKSEKYSLPFLNELLNINNISHRAYFDALTALRVFEKSIKELPKEVETTEQLIDFSKSNFKKMKEKI